MKRVTLVLAACALLLLGSLQPVPRASATQIEVEQKPLQWVEVAPMPTPRYAAGVAVSLDEQVFVLGGDNYSCTALAVVEAFDSTRNAWRTAASMPVGRIAFAAVTGPDGKIYAIGGVEPASSYCGFMTTGRVDVYDPATDQWSAGPSMPTPRYFLGAATGANGKIYAIGGASEGLPLAVVEEFDPLTGAWVRKADMPTPKQSFGIVAASNGKIYMLGGAESTNAVWEFDPVADTWTAKAAMLTGRQGFGAAQVRNGRIYAAGGFSQGVRTGTVESYDPATDTWTTETSLSAVRTDPAVAAVRNVILVIGGWSTRPDGSEGPVGQTVAAKSPRF